MILLRFLALIAAALVLTGVDRSSVPSYAEANHFDLSLLAGHSDVLKKSIDSNAASHHDAIPILGVEPAPIPPDPTYHPLALLGQVTVKLKHAYSSEFSGLSPPPCSIS